MKFLYKLQFIFILLVLFTLQISAENITKESLTLNSKSVILMSPQTSKILFEKNAYDKFYPASTTKVLTALIALERLGPKERVKISKKAASINGTKVGLIENSLYTVEDLIYGLLLNSGNDCAIALAEHLSGSEEEFAKLMNTKAKNLGLYSSNFINASGLHDKNHYTCAYDLSKILCNALKNKKFVEISTSKYHTILGIFGESFYISNQNQLLIKNGKYYYKDALLGKTGFTTPAQYTFVASAKKNNINLIAVTLKADSKESYLQDVITLFEYGFTKVKNLSLSK